MMQLRVVCTACGRTFRSCLDESCPPSQVRCRCGARFSLALEADEGNGAAAFAGLTDQDALDGSPEMAALSEVAAHG